MGKIGVWAVWFAGVVLITPWVLEDAGWFAEFVWLTVCLGLWARLNPYPWFRRLLTCGIYFRFLVVVVGNVVLELGNVESLEQQVETYTLFVLAGLGGALQTWMLRRGSDRETAGEFISLWIWILAGIVPMLVVQWGLNARRNSQLRGET